MCQGVVDKMIPFVTGLLIKNKTLSPRDRLLNVTTAYAT